MGILNNSLCRISRLRKRREFWKTFTIFVILSLFSMGAFVIPINVKLEEFEQHERTNSKKNQDDTFIQELFVEPIGNELGEPTLFDVEENKEPKKEGFHSRFINSEEIEKLFFAETRETKPTTENLPIKTILFYNEDFSDGKRYYGIGGIGKDTFRKNGCPIWQCEVYDYLMENVTIPDEQFDAIVFHDPTWYDYEENRPSKRSPHQRYVYWNQESPSVHSRPEQWDDLNGFFNLTMTHRWDSDIPHPYGWIVPYRPDSVPMNPNEAQLQKLLEATSTGENYATKKSRMAAWFVSHCNVPSGRDEYVKRLSQFIPVDIYGKCGTLECPKNKNEECRRMMERDYKFHISFENSLCIDYVTEKFFQQIKYDTIPIVLDLHGNYKQFAPPHSYINALDFPSVKELADYLSLLNRNDTLYNQYFWWKEHYEIRNNPEDFRHGLCRLCSILHETKLPSKSYDLTDWWDTKAECRALRFDKLSKDDPSYWTSELIPRYSNSLSKK